MENIIREGFVKVTKPVAGKPSDEQKWNEQYYILYGGMVNSQPRLCYGIKKNAPGYKTVYFEEITRIVRDGVSRNEFSFFKNNLTEIKIRLSSPQECTAWFNDMQNIAKGQTRINKEVSGNRQNHYTNVEEVEFDENELYDSVESDVFDIKILDTDASERCNLYGSYELHVGSQKMQLVNKEDKQAVLAWPYSYIRRSGGNKVQYVFEAGRRCDSGEGLFKFSVNNAKVLRDKISTYTEALKAKVFLKPTTPPVPPAVTMKPPKPPRLNSEADSNNNSSKADDQKSLRSAIKHFENLSTREGQPLHKYLALTDESLTMDHVDGGLTSDCAQDAAMGSATDRAVANEYGEPYEIAEAKFPPPSSSEYQEPTSSKELNLLYNRRPVLPNPHGKSEPFYAEYDVTQSTRYQQYCNEPLELYEETTLQVERSTSLSVGDICSRISSEEATRRSGVGEVNQSSGDGGVSGDGPMGGGDMYDVLNRSNDGTLSPAIRTRSANGAFPPQQNTADQTAAYCRLSDVTR